MTLDSALEDLRKTTLGAIFGGLRRLEYLSGLRKRTGSYEHWGLARIHGEGAAIRAIAEEHRTMVSQLLATPLRKLLEDLEKSSRQAGVLPAAYLKDLYRGRRDLLPTAAGTAAERHLSSVLRALSCLQAIQSADAIHPAS